MKKAASIFALLFVFTISIQAQKQQKKDQFTVEQRTELMLKKMTLKLDLTENQQKQVRPLLLQRVIDQKMAKKTQKKAKKNGKTISAEERYQRTSNRLDKQIAFKKKMKRILNENQYEKFEKMTDKKKRKLQKK